MIVLCVVADITTMYQM